MPQRTLNQPPQRLGKKQASTMPREDKVQIYNIFTIVSPKFTGAITQKRVRYHLPKLMKICNLAEIF
ncbi:hypothetical protein BN938_0213 [Mucinivorans hirudinis]|uniref:Uncharacterized protein n=1 Tax=Mucinivorans hirudinis TaxID=1433126 RepID=A0A060RAA8_9BACT|nr:hypothetical protein BN938_0213 [Mucinivorans hirudinis]